MSVDYSVDIMFGVELNIDSSEFYDDIEPEWDTSKYKVEISEFGDQMTEGGKYIAFYQPSYRSFDKWSGDFGCWSFEQLKENISEHVAIGFLLEAVKDLKVIGEPKWLLAHSVS